MSTKTKTAKTMLLIAGAALSAGAEAIAYFEVEGLPKVEKHPTTPDGEPYKVSINTAYPSLIDVSPAPAGVSPSVLEGFGENVPLTIGVAMVIPEGWTSQIHPRIAEDQTVSWKGGQGWPAVMQGIAESVQGVAFVDWSRRRVTLDPKPDGVLNPGGSVPGSSGGLKDVAPGEIPLLSDASSRIEAKPVPTYGVNPVEPLPGVKGELPPVPVIEAGVVEKRAVVKPAPAPVETADPRKGSLSEYEIRQRDAQAAGSAPSIQEPADRSPRTAAQMRPAHTAPSRIYGSVQDFSNERIQVDVTRVPLKDVLRSLTPAGWQIDASNVDEGTLAQLISLTAIDQRGTIMDSLARPLGLVMYPYPDLAKLIVGHRR